MSKQHHYIISYNTGSGQWELDAEAEQAFMPDGTILDLENASWYRDYSGDGEFYPEAERLSEIISKAIKQLNEGKQ